MFSSIFSTSPPVDPTAPNFHAVSDLFKENELVGELVPADTEWLCSGGFVTETQIFYTITDDGTHIMCQIIHSSTGMWFPTIQFTCKVYNPKTKETIWKSVNVSNFVTPPPGLDKRSSKADEYSVTYKSNPGSEFPESYTVNANLSQSLQVFLEIQRPASIPGFKVGDGPKGGYSYFGTDLNKPEGYVIHRFWPRYSATGHVMANGQASTVKGTGMLVHAIQGMRPNILATRWNFAHFQSDDLGGVSAIQMDFTTLKQYGPQGEGSGGVTVSVGSLVVGGKLATVTAETKLSILETPAKGSVQSRATHLKPVKDSDTGYEAPSAILYEWSGPSNVKDAPGQYSANLEVDLSSGLIEEVDVLAEIPYVLRKAVNYVAGTKPYIYQYFNPVTLHVKEPGSESSKDVNGFLYNEATFISKE